MILIGLRNPGKEYERTRHNAGAIVLEYLVKELGGEFENNKYFNSEKATVEFDGKDIDIYLPYTFMNLSGESVYRIVKSLESGPWSVHGEGPTNSYWVGKVVNSGIFVFFDDVTIPVGQYKISVGEGASSHNGIRSIVENIKSLGLSKDDFVRVRIGVGNNFVPSGDELSDFVLSNLNNLEITQIQGLGKKILSDIIQK